MKLDYSALGQAVTQADIDTYRMVYKDTFFTIPKSAQTVGIVLLVAVTVLILTLIMTGQGEAVSILIPFIMSIIIVVALVQATQKKIQRRAKVYKFALANDAQFIVSVQDPGYSGAIFSYGDNRSIVDAVVLPNSTEIGNYKYVTGSGKSRSEHHWGYVRVKLVRRLPHMLLDAKSNNIFGKISNLPQSFGKQTLSLEGDFDNYFTLYVPDGYQRDALYVLTPDVMAALVDAGKNYDIEIIDDELFIYGPAIDLGMQSSIEPLLNIIDRIGSELRDQTDRYRDDRAPSHAANLVAEPGRRLKKRMSTLQMIIAGIVILSIVINLVVTMFPFIKSISSW